MRDYVAGEDHVLAHEAGAGVDRVDVDDGQETWRVPARFLVPRDLAWAATVEFMRTGRRAPGLAWDDDPDVQPGPEIR